MYDSTKRVLDSIDKDHLADRLTGRGGGLRPSKPRAQGDDGLTQFVWRMARFHSGADPKMPVTATWWLQDWIDDQGIDASVSGILDDEGTEILEEIDRVVDEILAEEFDHDPTAGARRWKKAGAF